MLGDKKRSISIGHVKRGNGVVAKARSSRIDCLQERSFQWLFGRFETLCPRKPHIVGRTYWIDSDCSIAINRSFAAGAVKRCQSVNKCRATIARTPPAANVAPATKTVARCATSAARVCHAACRRSTSARHLWKSVVQPVTATANGRAMSSPQRPMRGRKAYHVTIRCAVCAGSYCGGCMLRTKSAVMNRTAGKMRSSSVVATVYFVNLISTL